MKIQQLSLAEIVTMQTIANGERCLAKTIANNILEFNGVEPVIEEVLYPIDESNERRSNTKKENNVSLLTNSDLKFYPNPANEYFNIELPEGTFIINLINAQGQVVYEYAQLGNSKINIDTKHITEGIYLLKVLNKNEIVLTEKISIKH